MDLLDTPPIRADDEEYLSYEHDYVYMENAELSKILLNVIDSSVVGRDDVAEMERTARLLINAGTYNHDKFHSYWVDYISGVLDIASLGVLPIVEGCTGYNPITGDTLSNKEKDAKFKSGSITLVVSCVTIASGGIVGGLGQAASTTLSLSVSGAGGYLIDVACTDYLDIPKGASFVIALVGGGYIYKVANQYFMKLGNQVVSVTEETVNRLSSSMESSALAETSGIVSENVNPLTEEMYVELFNQNGTRGMYNQEALFGESAVWEGNPIEGGNSSTIISQEMQNKILEGQRVSPTKNDIIGGHSSTINNDNPLFAVEVLSENADGTKTIKYVKDFQDGNISKIKKSTIFPETWSESDIIEAIKVTGDSPVLATRARDGATFHRQIINGVEIDVIKIGNNVTSGYPTGKVGAPYPSGF